MSKSLKIYSLVVTKARQRESEENGNEKTRSAERESRDELKMKQQDVIGKPTKEMKPDWKW